MRGRRRKARSSDFSRLCFLRARRAGSLAEIVEEASLSGRHASNSFGFDFLHDAVEFFAVHLVELVALNLRPAIEIVARDPRAAKLRFELALARPEVERPEVEKGAGKASEMRKVGDVGAAAAKTPEEVEH